MPWQVHSSGVNVGCREVDVARQLSLDCRQGFVCPRPDNVRSQSAIGAARIRRAEGRVYGRIDYGRRYGLAAIHTAQRRIDERSSRTLRLLREEQVRILQQRA